MEEVKTPSSMLALFGMAGMAFGQAVCTGTTEQCRASMNRTCKEARTANINLAGKHQLRGTVHDPTGAPFSASYAAELRDPVTGRPLKFAPLDGNGRFQFVDLNYGRVNWVLALMKDGKPERTGFIMPDTISCGQGESCEVQLVLKSAPTDTPKYLCPLE